jgi:hypothetical protein
MLASLTGGQATIVIVTVVVCLTSIVTKWLDRDD